MNVTKMELKLKNLTDSLLDKEKKSRHIISEALSIAKTPYCVLTGEMNSLVVLHLIKLLQDGSINLPVLHIDTTVEFPEIYQFIEKMQRLWGFRLVRERNDEALRTITIAEDKELCCRLLKTEALRNAIHKYGIDYLFLPKRLDEKGEDPFFSVQGKCTLVDPLSHFSEEDSWQYIKKYNLPHCSLWDQDHTEIVCYLCTPSHLDKRKKMINDITVDKKIAEKLKELGYL